MRAADGGHDNIVNHLLQHGANVNAINTNDETALQLARARGHLNITTQLMQAGAN
jgi:ankyrin repeat protein